MDKLRKSFNEISGALRTEGSFVQNSAWMFASSGISILIQFVFFYLLARIYSPAAYGLFGIFNFYSSTLGNSATLGYNQAFVLPQKEREFSALLRLTIWIALVFCALIFITSILFGKTIIHLFDHDVVGNWVYWIAPVSLLLAFDRIACDWAIRNKEFRQQTIWSTGITLASKSFNVGYGMLIAATTAGLVFTTLLQHGLRVIAYARFVLVDFGVRTRDRFTRQELREVAKEYKEFPLYIYWGNVINIFSSNLPAALLTPLGFSLETVGFYTYSLIVLDLPIRMLGAGISSVFLQKAAELARDRMHELVYHTWRLYKNIVFVSLVFSFIVFVFAEKIYVALLGERWLLAGRLAELLMIFYFFRMISSPLQSLFNVLRKEKQFFIFQVMLTIVRIGSLVFGVWFSEYFTVVMLIYSLANAVMHFILCLWIFRLIHFPLWKVSLFTLASGGGCFVLGYLIRHAIF